MIDYIIDKNTFAVIPDYHGCKIINARGSFTYPIDVKKLIIVNCKYYGSSLNYKLDISKKLLGNNYKLPIILNGESSLILFPTESYRNNNCIWVNLDTIVNYFITKDNLVKIVFNNGSFIEINISYSSFHNQVLRASRLESIHRQKVL